MTVIVVDDEELARQDLIRTLEVVDPECEVQGFALPRDVLAFAQDTKVDVAFLDIEMPGMNGLELAKRLKDLWPDVHIIFATSYENYAVDAFALHATGYLLKPVRREELARELTFVYGRLVAAPGALLEVKTFGGFAVSAGGVPLVFRRSKAKELLALLVDRRGGALTLRDACAYLWEDEPFTKSQRSYYQNIVSDLRTTLQEAGAGDVLVKSWNSLAIAPGLLDCDSYRFLEGDPIAVNSYHGDYLPEYPWSEFSVARFDAARRERG